MKTYEELFMNPFFPDLKVIEFAQILSKNDKINKDFAEKMQNSSLKSDISTESNENKDLFPVTVLKNVTPKKSLFSKLRGD